MRMLKYFFFKFKYFFAHEKFKHHPKKLHTYGSWEVFFLCSPECTKQPRTSFPFYKFFYSIISAMVSGGLPLKQASSAWVCILPWFRVLSRYISWSQTFGCLILIPTQAVLGCSSEMQWVLDVLWKFSALITSRRPPIY